MPRFTTDDFRRVERRALGRFWLRGTATSRSIVALGVVSLGAVGISLLVQSQGDAQPTEANPSDLEPVVLALGDEARGAGARGNNPPRRGNRPERKVLDAVEAKMPPGASVAERRRWRGQREQLTDRSIRSNPARVSMNMRATRYSRNATAAELAAYLDRVEPSRIHDVLSEAEGNPELMPSGSTFSQVAPGEAVTLAVTAPPRSPVTFVSYDLGAFQNGLTTITVLSNARGRAEAMLTATPGTTGNVTVAAASPVASGQVSFLVEVEEPAALDAE